METLGLKELLEHQNGWKMLLTETDSSWRWVGGEPSSPLLMEPLGLKELLEHQNLSLESPTEMDSSWRWVGKEPSSSHLMESLGIKDSLEHQRISMKLPTLDNFTHLQKQTLKNSSPSSVWFLTPSISSIIQSRWSPKYKLSQSLFSGSPSLWLISHSGVG